MIGDIHGCSKTFVGLLEKINLTFGDELFLLGDYIDKGLNSKAVLDHIISLKKEGYKIIPLRGNHEDMLLGNYIGETVKGWFDLADKELLSSFGIENLKGMSEDYIQFCNNLEYYHSEKDFIAVHAGLNFSNYNPFENADKPDPFANKEDLLWIRNWYDKINYEWLENRIIVHGHSPQTKSEIEEQFNILDEKRVLNIDCGAFLSKQKEHGLGYLCAFDFTNKELIFQENIEDENIY